jgi:hypothetical protein
MLGFLSKIEKPRDDGSFCEGTIEGGCIATSLSKTGKTKYLLTIYTSKSGAIGDEG